MLAAYPKNKIINNLFHQRFLTEDKTLPGANIGTPKDEITDYVTRTYRGKEYITHCESSYALQFFKDKKEVLDFIAKQEKLSEQYSTIFHYKKSERIANRGVYRAILFINGYGFVAEEIINLLERNYEQEQHDDDEAATPEGTEEPEPIEPKETISPKLNDGKLFVDNQAILDAIGFKTRGVQAHGRKHDLIWQENMLFDKNRFIICLGSRQIGKSKTMAARALLKSFSGYQKDIGVLAFQNDTTGHIKKYIKQYISNLEDIHGEGIFKENAQQSWITNQITGSRIIFRSLSEGGGRVRGFTFDEVIMDECFLIENEIFTKVVLPTVTATGGSIFMISTPGTQNWFFHEVTKASQGFKNYSFYKVTIDDNPFIDDEMREMIHSQKESSPSIRQEYYCEFTSNGNQVFRPEVIDSFDCLSDASKCHFVLAYDPARKGVDRAAYACFLVKKNEIFLIRSGFLEDHYKEQYDKQRTYIGNIMEEFPYELAIDCTGLGDGVVHIFKEKLKVSMALQYTAGDSESEDTSYPYGSTKALRVGKSRLINTSQDYFDQKICKVLKFTNKSFIEEIGGIIEIRYPNGLIGFKSSGFDDITNAVMIGLYYINYNNLTSKPVLGPGVTNVFKEAFRSFTGTMKDTLANVSKNTRTW